MPGIGGGGLGGGGPSGGYTPAAADPSSAGAEDPMKDLLHDMKDAAAEGDGSGEEQSAEAESGVAERDSLELFPRVRACHVRSLKQGKFLNGLGDRIQPD